MAEVRTYAGLMLAGVVLLVAVEWPSGQQAQFRATTDFVFRDVRVFDARGRVVMELRREDFRVREDGVEQKIEWFVRSAGNRILTDEQPRTAPTEGLILPAPKTSEDMNGRILIILIDDLHLQARDSPRIQNVLRVLRDEIVKSNDRIAIVSSGYSSIAQNLTFDPDHSRLDAAIRKVMGGAPTPAEVIAAASTAEGPAGLRYNAHVAFGTAYSMLEQLEHIPGRRKALFYVSNGYDFSPFESSRLKAEMDRSSIPGQTDQSPQVNPFETRGQQFAESDLARELAELVKAANRANTAIYTIDPRGLIGGPDIDTDLGPTEWWKFVNSGISSLQVLASETMGRAVVNTNGFAQAFRRIDAELSDYYVIGYQSTNRDPLKRTRQVDISVAHPGLRLEYQTRYSLRLKQGGLNSKSAVLADLEISPPGTLRALSYVGGRAVAQSPLRSLSSLAICVAIAGAWSAVIAAQRGAQPAAAGDATLEIQILLDRAGFSPGEIDGLGGSNTAKAIAAFESSRRIPPGDRAALLQALSRGAAEVLTPYTITAEDVAGPFTPSIPQDLMEQSKLPALHYTSVLEALAETFHASPQLLQRLNPTARFVEGETIQAPNVSGSTPAPVPANAKVMVSRDASVVTVFDGGGQIVFHAPVTSGSEKDPLPLGSWTVTAVIKNPTFNYNPDLFWDADPSHAKAKIPAGPNGPVGVVWIDISKEHYGLHGTPEPGRIGHSSSHGCVRLTNWDAAKLAAFVKKGTPVVFEQ